MVCNKGVRHFPEHLKGLPKHLAVDRPGQIGAKDLVGRDGSLLEGCAPAVRVRCARVLLAAAWPLWGRLSLSPRRLRLVVVRGAA